MVSSRFAFTLLELVVTIVVLGFIASAIPTLLISDQKSRDFSLVQEAIYASSAKMSQILSYKWDEASNENNNSISNAKVLDINTGNAALWRASGKFRVGHFQETGRRSLFNDETNATTVANLGPDADMDDIDDALTAAQNLLSGAASGDGYKDSYTIDVNVNYILDDANYSQTTINNFEFENITNANPTNIKRLGITIKDSTGETLFNLTTYSSNIGESSVSSRVYQ